MNAKLTFLREFSLDAQIGIDYLTDMNEALVYNSMNNIFSKKERERFIGQFPTQVKF